MSLNIYEEKIYRVLVKNKRSLSTKQIRDFTNISWQVCKDSLESLVIKKGIVKIDLKNKINWSLNWKINDCKHKWGEIVQISKEEELVVCKKCNVKWIRKQE